MFADNGGQHEININLNTWTYFFIWNKEKAKKTITYKLSPMSLAQPNKCPSNRCSLKLGSLSKVAQMQSYGIRNTIVDYCFQLHKWGLASSTFLHNFVVNLNSCLCSDKPVPHWQGGHLHPPPAAGGQHHQVHRERLHPLQRVGRNQRWPVVLLLWFQVCYNTKLVQLSRVSSKPSERILRGNSLLWI